MTHNEGRAAYISESGLYKLLERCSLPIGQKFEGWVYNAVLQSIQKTGGYQSEAARKQMALKNKEHVEQLSIKDAVIEEKDAAHALINYDLQDRVTIRSRLSSMRPWHFRHSEMFIKHKRCIKSCWL